MICFTCFLVDECSIETDFRPYDKMLPRIPIFPWSQILHLTKASVRHASAGQDRPSTWAEQSSEQCREPCLTQEILFRTKNQLAIHLYVVPISWLVIIDVRRTKLPLSYFRIIITCWCKSHDWDRQTALTAVLLDKSRFLKFLKGLFSIIGILPWLDVFQKKTKAKLHLQYFFNCVKPIKQ